MRLFLLLLVCLPDHDLRLFIIRVFFPVGGKAALVAEAGNEAAVLQ